MIKNYITMKKNEWRIKTTVYSTIVALIDNQKDLLLMLQKLYVALKDVPAEELQKELIGKIAEIIDKENRDKN